MRIDHVAMYVNDLERMKHFYQKYFNASCNDLYHNKTTGLQTYFLTYDDGARLEIMYKPNLEWFNGGPNQAGYIHLAFRLGSRERVDDMTAQ